MEHSFYTVETEIQPGEYALFNTLHGALVVLNTEAYTQYKNLDGPHIEALRQAGFIQKSAWSEVEAQKNWLEQTKRSTDTLALCVAPTYECNLACPHCYEKDLDIRGSMSDDTLNSIMRFTEQIFDRDKFSHLFITWYGGEPTLCTDIIEKLSAQFIQFCEGNFINYGAEIITNATLVDDALAKRLANCKINQAMPTLAGNKGLHNQRRCAKANADSYDLTLRGIESLKNAGISVILSMNMDKSSLEDFQSMRDWLDSNTQYAMPIMIGDYLKNNPDQSIKEDDFDLFTREEFSWVLHDWYKKDYNDATKLGNFLSPIQNYCRRQLENYFVIDALGDVYKCDGRMGYKEYSLFNISDSVEVDTLRTVSDNPLDDKLCQTCPVLPLCKGQCAWDRALLEDGCHPLKYTIQQYVKDYRNYFGAASSPVTVFVEPRNLDAFFSRPNLGNGLSPSSYS